MTKFRANVGLAVTNPGGEVLLLRRADHPDAWQMPQGGIEHGEEPSAAAWRELAEETGLGPGDVELRRVMDVWLGYELPEPLRTKKTGRGQVQLWHHFGLTGPAARVAPGHEFTAARWADWDEAIAQVVAFRRAIYRQVRDFVRATGP